MFQSALSLVSSFRHAPGGSYVFRCQDCLTFPPHGMQMLGAGPERRLNERLYILFFCFCIGILWGVEAEPPASELTALLSLKASWSNSSNSLASWESSNKDFICEWRGVRCSDDNATIISLELSGLSLDGPLSSSIRNLRNLHTLNLAFNQLYGNIPDELGLLPSLQNLELRHNHFNGSIPESIFTLTSLRRILLENNHITGTISSSISNLSNLTYLSFTNNSLSGSLPKSLTNLSRLVALYGGDNQLNGDIPLRLGDLRSLSRLDLHGNSLRGGIPSSIGLLKKLISIQLNKNELSGGLPIELGALPNVTTLDLSFNNLNGSIPAELSHMSSLETLNLQHNNFSGSISPLLGGLSKLKSFNLSYNNLTGQIPRDGILRNFSAASFEGNAFLCGDPLVNITCSSPPPTTLVPVPSPPLPPLSSLKNDLLSRGSNNTWKVIIGVVVSVFALSMFIICMTIFVRRSRMKRARQVPNGLSSERGVANSSSKLEMYNRGFRFTYEEIVSHAGYYDTAHIVGKGRFATVYRSDLPGGIQMAVKVFKDTISRPAFEKEVETLESASHFDTLLPIRGYFSSAGEKAILYEFMPEGNLYDMLHNNPDAHVQLDWPIRINIAMGIAQALAHLHKGSSTRVLHKDVKSTNVLLNDKLSPFVADYGTVGLVSKSIVETPGYMAPELNVTKKYTEKTDVYGFGVVLVEILTGKKPVSYIGDRQLSLVNWTLRLHRSGRGREVFSSRLVETCPYPDYPDKALNLAVLCLHELPGQRPTMSEVASMLESLNAVHSPLKSPVFQHDRPLLQGS